MFSSRRRKTCKRKEANDRQQKPFSYRPWLELLEERRLLTTFLVVNTNDSGAGSLRQALLDSNSPSSPGPNVIDFNIPASGVQTISPATALPVITNPVTIDGYSQPGANPNTNGSGLADNAVMLIQLKGASSTSASSGLTIAAGNSTIRGLVINGFANVPAIDVQTNGGNIIAGDFVGTDPTGALAMSVNGDDGVRVESGGNNTIGGTHPADRNLISGNGGIAGIDLFPGGGGSNLIQGNFIGTDATGTKAINPTDGIIIQQSNGNTIGGTAAGAGNLISGNAGDALDIRGPGNLVQGNLIGTDVTGTLALGNRDGIAILGNAGFTVNNTIGGTAAGAGNVIAASSLSGFQIDSFGGTVAGTLIQGNLIGTQKDGARPLGNFDDGILLGGSSVWKTRSSPTELSASS
jgi:hypothetical protein